MEQLEKVEKLRQRANVSYEEAKEALEASDWDLLDAMVYLDVYKRQMQSRARFFRTARWMILLKTGAMLSALIWWIGQTPLL